jgi:hypothetical protein
MVNAQNNFIDVTNLCIRCGKQRITVSSRQETVGAAIITYTEMSCPDPLCQKKVDNDLNKERERRQHMMTPPLAHAQRPAQATTVIAKK